MYHDVCIDGFGTPLEQKQPDGSVRPTTYISRATLDSEGYWTPLDLEAGSIVGAINRLRGYLWTIFFIFADHKALESIGEAEDYNAFTPLSLEFLTVFDYTLEYLNGSANEKKYFFCPVCQSSPRNTTAVGPEVSPPSMTAVSSSSDPAAFALVLQQLLASAWMS